MTKFFCKKGDFLGKMEMAIGELWKGIDDVQYNIIGEAGKGLTVYNVQVARIYNLQCTIEGFGNGRFNEFSVCHPGVHFGVCWVASLSPAGKKGEAFEMSGRFMAGFS